MKEKPVFIALLLVLTLVILSGCTSQDDQTQLPGDEQISQEMESQEGELSDDGDQDEETPDSEAQEEESEAGMGSNLTQQINYKSISPFTGLPLKEDYYSRAVAVSIENSPAARPQSGLNEAEIVYEFMTEGGITRFLALFWPEIPEKVGPIRSARPFLIETAAAYDSLFLHAGASPDGFQMLSEIEIINLDQIYQSQYYWRSSKRQAPHNLYSGRPSLSPYLSQISAREYPEQFEFLTASVVSDFIEAEEISIDYWGDYEVLYRYNKLENRYQRYLNDFDTPHTVESGETISAKNIIVQYVETQTKDRAGRLDLDLDSGGKMELFRDGIVIEGSWEKTGQYNISYLTSSGEKIMVNPGETWIQVVPSTTEVGY